MTFSRSRKRDRYATQGDGRGKPTATNQDVALFRSSKRDHYATQASKRDHYAIT